MNTLLLFWKAIVLFSVSLIQLSALAQAQQAYLKASNTSSGAEFGYSVSVSGDTAVIGAHGESSSGTGVNDGQSDTNAQSAGAAYVFVRSGTNWIQQAYFKASNTDAGDQFGQSVAISGDTVVVGAWFEGSSAIGVNGDQTDNTAFAAGAAYVFVREGTNWSQQAYLKASNTDAGDWFGYSVAISGDTIAVGAIGESSKATGVNGDQTDNSLEGAGAVYVFVRNGTDWSQQAYLKASNPDVLDRFGSALAISGDTLLVGAFAESSAATGVNGNESDNSASFAGAAYVFTRTGTDWSQEAYLKASNTRADAAFGNAVAISGDTAVVGAWYESSSATGVNGNQNDANAPYAGAAYVFYRTGTNWGQQAYLKASNTHAGASGEGDLFGGSVTVFGDTAVIGAFGEPSSATGVDGDQSDTNAFYSGAAYVFYRTGTNWSQQAYLKASNTRAGAAFGAVALSGDTLVATAGSESSSATGVNGNQSDTNAPSAGAAYVFTRLASTRVKVTIMPIGPAIVISWPTNVIRFVLQSATTLVGSGDWQDVKTTPAQTNDVNTVTVSNTGSQSFFRLRGP